VQILVISELMGAMPRVKELVQKCSEYSLDAVCFCGNVVNGQARAEEWLQARKDGRVPNRNQVGILEEALEDLKQYRVFCQTLDSLGVPVMLVPGVHDAPEERFFLFMQQAAFVSDNVFLLHENVTKVEKFIFTGFGGEITVGDKEDYFLLKYPRQECIFGTRRMRFLNPPRIVVFHSPPVSSLDLEDGLHRGSQFVNELIEAVAPSFLFCGSVPKALGAEVIGDTLAVNPGALALGQYALVNTLEKSARLLTL
jgi:Icc-related predicted phosphoesterase